MKTLITASVIAIALLTGGLAGCSSGGNSASGMNAALVDYVNAQVRFSAPTGDTSPESISQSWIDTYGSKTARMRETFEILRVEAEQVEFPETTGVKGEPSQSTMTEYLNANDLYISMNEEFYNEMETCTSNGGDTYECATLTNINMQGGMYPDVVKRVQTATQQLREESSVG